MTGQEMVEYHFNLLADYYQFYLQDEEAEGDLSESWTPEAAARFLALAAGTIGVGTARNMTVPLTIEVRETPPTDDFAAWNLWDKVNACSICVPSGRLIVAGCTDYLPDAIRITVAPGTYQARIFYGGLDRQSDDGLEGEDHYSVVLWPGEEMSVRVLKPRL